LQNSVHQRLVKRDDKQISDLPLEATKEVLPNQSSLGWKNDANKNLPGIRELYLRWPNAKWYIMVDDDTYVGGDYFQFNNCKSVRGCAECYLL
jgi:hypothetical protein